MGKTLQILIVILVAIAAGLAYLISTQPNENQVALIPSVSPKQPELSVPYHEMQNPSSPPFLSPLPEARPASPKDRAAIMAFPDSKTPADERAKYNALVAKLARAGNVLSVSGCSPNPLVLLVSLTKDITITNSDPTKRRIFSQEPTIEIPANSSLVVHPSKIFAHGPGNYGYFCDGSSTVSGVFLVIP